MNGASLSDAERERLIAALHDFPLAGAPWLVFRDGVYAAVERVLVERLAAVEALHHKTCRKGVSWHCTEGECTHPICHEGGAFPEFEFEVCAYCMNLADENGLLDEYWPAWVLWPCATAAALQSTAPLASTGEEADK